MNPEEKRAEDAEDIGSGLVKDDDAGEAPKEGARTEVRVFDAEEARYKALERNQDHHYGTKDPTTIAKMSEFVMSRLNIAEFTTELVDPKGKLTHIRSLFHNVKKSRVDARKAVERVMDNLSKQTNERGFLETMMRRKE